MKKAIKMMIFATVLLFTAFLSGQSDLKTPTADEARITCLTLERLLGIASHEDQAADSLALSRAYKLALRYVPDGSSLRDATDYVEDFDHKNHALEAQLASGKGGGFTHRTANDLAELGPDDEHRAAVIIVGKGDTYQVMHSDLDPATISKMMLDTGKAFARAGGRAR